MSKSKQLAWKWCSRYCRLRDALEYCKEVGIDTGQFARIEDIPVKCCTCNIVKAWIYIDAGHYISRGSGGSSGVYFDERNIHAQSKDCNAFKQGAPIEYKKYMLNRYGQDVITDLEFKHHIPLQGGELAMKAMQVYYSDKFKELKERL